MDITVRYFGMIEEWTGLSSETLVKETQLSIEKLISEITHRHPLIEKSTFNIAVDQKLVTSDTMIIKDCEIALLPPFAGG